MDFTIILLNDIAVSLYGSILAGSFCDLFRQDKKRNLFLCFMLIIPLVQTILYHYIEKPLLRKCYPLFIHLPLLVVLCFLTRQILWPFMSILTGYLCCQLRRWMGLLLTAIIPFESVTLELSELILTVPLLFLLLRYASPAISGLSVLPLKRQFRFTVIPLLYYVFDYATTVYTDLLTSGNTLAVEFMPFVCCLAYLIFLAYDNAEQKQQDQMKLLQDSMKKQLSQAVREIDSLRSSEELTRRYRHDMRHHMQYISSLIENGKAKEAQTYISTICDEIEKQKVMRYSENETVNLILSSYFRKAEKNGIKIKVSGSFPASVKLSSDDLCILFSNALENALHASHALVSEGRPAYIDIKFQEKKEQIFLQIKNPFSGEIRFKNGMPLTEAAGHGIGTRSICAVTERYGGICSFQAKDGEFILRISV